MAGFQAPRSGWFWALNDTLNFDLARNRKPERGVLLTFLESVGRDVYLVPLLGDDQQDTSQVDGLVLVYRTKNFDASKIADSGNAHRQSRLRVTPKLATREAGVTAPPLRLPSLAISSDARAGAYQSATRAVRHR